MGKNIEILRLIIINKSVYNNSKKQVIRVVSMIWFVSEIMGLLFLKVFTEFKLCRIIYSNNL